jgi:hypothetical protein
MQVMKETPGQSALTIDKSASLLGLHEFSLMSRIQVGEIKVARATSGEMVIPESELERLAGGVPSARNRLRVGQSCLTNAWASNGDVAD